MKSANKLAARTKFSRLKSLVSSLASPLCPPLLFALPFPLALPLIPPAFPLLFLLTFPLPCPLSCPLPFAFCALIAFALTSSETRKNSKNSSCVSKSFSLWIASSYPKAWTSSRLCSAKGGATPFTGDDRGLVGRDWGEGVEGGLDGWRGNAPPADMARRGSYVGGRTNYILRLSLESFRNKSPSIHP